MKNILKFIQEKFSKRDQVYVNVAFTKSTAKINPQMIVREYNKLINEQETYIKHLKRKNRTIQIPVEAIAKFPVEQSNMIVKDLLKFSDDLKALEEFSDSRLPSEFMNSKLSFSLKPETVEFINSYTHVNKENTLRINWHKLNLGRLIEERDKFMEEFYPNMI